MPTTLHSLHAIPAGLGLLPVGLVLFGLLVVGVARALPLGPGRLVGGCAVVLAATVVVCRGLAGIGILGPVPLLVLGLAALAVWRFSRAPLGIPWRALATPAAALGFASIAGAVVAARLIPVWQWDSLGYHLPFVDFVLWRGRFADVPVDVPYLSSYPHGVEWVTAAFRSLLADDRLVDAVQIPFGLFGALAAAVLARRAGAGRRLAVATGALWLALPAVFLQLPTNYVDVAAASYLLAALALVESRPWLAAVALGLFLGAKPTAPLPCALASLLLVWQVRHPRVLGMLALVFVLGGESYVTNIWRHHNPIWPVGMSLGPIHLPGIATVGELLASGTAAPHTTGSLAVRLWASLTALDPPPAFDMRIGGFGPLFLAILVIAVIVRRRDPRWLFLLLIAAASPDPSVARYVMALPAVALAIVAGALSAYRYRARLLLSLTLAMAVVIPFVRSWRGLTGTGPLLLALARMTDAERVRSVGPDGSPALFVDARERLQPGDTAGYDSGFELSGLLWPMDLSNRVLRLGADSEADLDAAHVRLRVACHGPVRGTLLGSFDVDHCGVYWR